MKEFMNEGGQEGNKVDVVRNFVWSWIKDEAGVVFPKDDLDFVKNSWIYEHLDADRAWMSSKQVANSLKNMTEKFKKEGVTKKLRKQWGLVTSAEDTLLSENWELLWKRERDSLNRYLERDPVTNELKNLESLLKKQFVKGLLKFQVWRSKFRVSYVYDDSNGENLPWLLTNVLVEKIAHKVHVPNSLLYDNLFENRGDEQGIRSGLYFSIEQFTKYGNLISQLDDDDINKKLEQRLAPLRKETVEDFVNRTEGEIQRGE